MVIGHDRSRSCPCSFLNFTLCLLDLMWVIPRYNFYTGFLPFSNKKLKHIACGIVEVQYSVEGGNLLKLLVLLFQFIILLPVLFELQLCLKKAPVFSLVYFSLYLSLSVCDQHVKHCWPDTTPSISTYSLYLFHLDFLAFFITNCVFLSLYFY